MSGAHLLAVGVVLLFVGCGDDAAGECISDAECKGGRICELGECKDPIHYLCDEEDLGCNNWGVRAGTILNAPRCEGGRHIFQTCGGNLVSSRCYCGDSGDDPANTAGRTGTSGGASISGRGNGDDAGSATGGRSNGDFPVLEFQCEDLPQRDWIGTVACTPLPGLVLRIAGRLATLWGTPAPQIFCRYDASIAGSNACGPFVPNNAIYCPLDESISYDASMLTNFAQAYGAFASAVIIAHEWGHHNQQRLGTTGVSNKRLELQADCQAGIFAAVEEEVGNALDGDVEGAFNAICEFGDQYASPWFQVGAHGTCPERQTAFMTGYQGAQEDFSAVCNDNPLTAVERICDGTVARMAP